MEANNTYMALAMSLKNPKVYHNIAAHIGAAHDDKFFKSIYNLTSQEIFKSLEKKGIQPGTPASEEEKNMFLQGFVQAIGAKLSVKKKLKQTNQLYATDKYGWMQPVPGSTMNEDADDWTEAEKKALYQQLLEGGYIGRIRDEYKRHHPEAGIDEFKQALKMGVDIAFDQVERYMNPPLMPSDLDEVTDGIQEIVLSFNAAKSIFQSDPSHTGKEREPKPTTKRDLKKFQNFSYGRKPDGSAHHIGLNEAIDDWSESKLDSHIKKAVEKELKSGEYMSKKDVKDMIRKTIVKQYKYLWEKSAFFINQI